MAAQTSGTVTSGAVPCHIEDVTPLWLTERLRDRGALASGSVTGVAAEVGAKWNTALTARLTLDYDAKTSAEAPRSLFIKLSKPNDPLVEIFPGEIAFYSEALPRSLPLARCYGAEFDPSSGSAFILLEDLSPTHWQTPWPKAPAIQCREAAVTGLARLHAHWWVGRVSETLAESQRRHHERLAEEVQRLLPAFLDYLGDSLATERRALMERVLGKIPALMIEREASGSPVTRIHSDPHFWNVMYPKDPARHGCVFVDWEDWRIHAGGVDLAYMIALYLDRERRNRNEAPLLRGYHEALHQSLRAEFPGGYGWDDLLLDYRLGHLQNFVVPVFQFHMGVSEEVRRPQLKRLFQAFDDLDCAALL